MFSVSHLNNLRSFEIDKIVRFMEPGARVLEIGAGTGRQAAEIAARGFEIEAIEIPSSNYASERLFRITDYDGHTIPFPDQSFDIVFSSNVLEHVPDLPRLHLEIRRVLRPDGYCLHVLPTHSWRFWTILSSFPDAPVYAFGSLPSLVPRLPLGRSEIRRLSATWLNLIKRCASPLLQPRHGERGNLLSEIWLFRPGWWRKNFAQNHFEVVFDEPMGLFYTGNMLFGARWSFEGLQDASSYLGSACHIFKIRPSGVTSSNIS
jgi:SAM-dependent methyltransferase